MLPVAAGSSGGLQKLGWTEPRPWEEEASATGRGWGSSFGRMGEGFESRPLPIPTHRKGP